MGVGHGSQTYHAAEVAHAPPPPRQAFGNTTRPVNHLHGHKRADDMVGLKSTERDAKVVAGALLGGKDAPALGLDIAKMHITCT